MSRRLAYLMSRFPHLPETFILREMVELQRQGWEVALYPLILQRQTVVHADARPWLARAEQVPFISAGVVATNAATLARTPRRYGTLLGQTLWENRSSPNLLVRAVALLPKAVSLARRMQAEGIAHVHAHYATHPALVAWLIHRLTGISYSITVHAHDIFVRTAMLATKLREAAFVVAISEYNRQHLAQVLGPWVRARTHVVHCGIVASDYEVRTSPPAPGEPFELINVGSLQPYKGQRHLIQACALLRERGIALRCRIVGGGKERSALERLIAQAGLESVVELLGPRPQEEVARLLPTAHCYVQPSIITPSGKMEGLPVALMEALACNLPVVATSLSGIPELVRHGETGLLVPPADAAALADALLAVYEDPRGAARMATAGRALVLREFDLRANVTQLAALFEQATQPRSERLGQTMLVAAGGASLLR